MRYLTKHVLQLQGLLERTRVADFLAPLLLRLYLAPVFWMAGTSKLQHMDATIAWFGGELGLPFPALLAWAAALTETLGAVALVAGLAVRWFAIPLMVTMVVAAVTVHWEHGWLAISDSAGEQLAMAREILREYGNYDWLTSQGRFVVLNNGIEFAATYFVMLLALFFTGAGRFVGLDYWIARWMGCRPSRHGGAPESTPEPLGKESGDVDQTTR